MHAFEIIHQILQTGDLWSRSLRLFRQQESAASLKSRRAAEKLRSSTHEAAEKLQGSMHTAAGKLQSSIHTGMHSGEVGGMRSAPTSRDDRIVGLVKGFGRRDESHVNELEILLDNWSADLQVRITWAVSIDFEYV